MEYRYLMPSIGTRKLYWLIKPKLLEQGLKFGRDQLFKVLKENDLLIRPKRRYTALLHKPICKGFFSDIIFK
ncbi:hypothetical protein AhaeAN3_14075 [Acinetobacter haemolyticus]|nr:hypothetical protein AhaeAN3_14075 [Acinetobacter haemolyticus]